MTDPRPLKWVGTSKRDYKEFPPELQDEFGTALLKVQLGEREIPGAKPLSQGARKGLGIFELVGDYDGDTYRSVYTVKFAETVYVLHAFKKKSHSWIATPRHVIDLIRQRYERALADHRETHGPKKDRR